MPRRQPFTFSTSETPFWSRYGASFSILVVLLTPLCCQAQDDPYHMLEKVRQLEVDSIGGTVPVYFSPGYEERAAHLRAMLEEATDFFEASLGFPVKYNLAVLNELHWSELRKGPYGIPYVSLGKPWLIVLPAIPERSLVVGEISRYLDEALAHQMVDLIGFHELGHVYTSEYLYLDNFAGPYPPIRWFDEMLGTYFAYAFLRHKFPQWAQAWDTVTDKALGFPEQQFISLSDFDEKYYEISRAPESEGPSNYGWYQAAFHDRAREVFEVQGIGFLVRLKKELPWERFDQWILEEVLAWLEAIEPGFQAWARGPAP